MPSMHMLNRKYIQLTRLLVATVTLLLLSSVFFSRFDSSYLRPRTWQKNDVISGGNIISSQVRTTSSQPGVAPGPVDITSSQNDVISNKGGVSVIRTNDTSAPVEVNTKSANVVYCPPDENSCPSYDNWPHTSRKFKGKRSPYTPTKPVYWSSNYKELLVRLDVIRNHPKIITWMVKPRYWPELDEPVRMRVCPEMPCRMTTNAARYSKESSALVWNAQIMRDPAPPDRSHPDQVYLFHNDEPQMLQWIPYSSFRKPVWQSAFNWTMTYRSDSDFYSPYAILEKRDNPVVKNYTDIWVKKTKFAAWPASWCATPSQREHFVNKLKQYTSLDVYGDCGTHRCSREDDNQCFKKYSTEYKFYLAFENSFCEEYVSEKMYRYLELDTVLVTRGIGHKKAAPPGSIVSTDDFASIEELANHLKYLDTHPEEYIKMLKAKDGYVPLYEDYPTRDINGNIIFMEYHYEAVPFCELCLRLWNLEGHSKYYPSINEWFDKKNCIPPPDRNLGYNTHNAYILILCLLVAVFFAMIATKTAANMQRIRVICLRTRI